MPFGMACQPWPVRPSNIRRTQHPMTPEPGKREMIVAFAAGLVTFSLLYAPQPVLHLIADRYGIAPQSSALMISLPSALLSATSLLPLLMARPLNPARLVPLALTLATLVNLVAILSSHWGTLVAARGVTGVLIGAVPSAMMTFLATQVPPERMGRAMAIYVAGTGTGGLSGRLAAGMLSTGGDYVSALLVTNLIALAICVTLFLLFPRTGAIPPPPAARARVNPARVIHALVAPRAASVYLIGFLLMSAFVGMFNYLPFLLSSPRFGLPQAGLTFAFLPLAVGIIAVPLFGRHYDVLGPRKMLSFAFAMIGCGGLMTLTEQLDLLFVGIVLVALGAFAGHSSATATLARQSVVEKAYASSFYFFFYYLGSGISGYASGVFFATGGWTSLIRVMTVVVVTGILLTILTQPDNNDAG